MSKRKIIKGVKIDDVQPDSVVGRDVLGLQNQVILKKGVKLTSNLVAQIKRMGIGTIFIEAEEEVAELDPKALEEKKQIVDILIERKFRRASPDNRVMMGLKDIFREFLKGKITNGS
ncbi:MAG: hypothetical protein D4R73_11965 [Deltaproteobacteria bacterium]|nr:MAG: hypothetical protein D4R73_11965 [Deltaproteobacteria bacterium]